MLIGVVAHVSEYFCLSRWDQLALRIYFAGDSEIPWFALSYALATRVYIKPWKTCLMDIS